jgi:hypothetical protein
MAGNYTLQVEGCRTKNSVGEKSADEVRNAGLQAD